MTTQGMRITNEQEAREWLSLRTTKVRIGRELCDCINGHFECATVTNGHCLDEVLSTYPALAQ